MNQLPDYYCKKIEINGKEVAIMIDKDLGNISLTNSIDEVAKIENVKFVIYKDSMGNFDYWDSENGFKSLAKNGIPSQNEELAIEIAKEKFF